MADGKALAEPAEKIVEAFADAGLDGSLRDGGMFVIGWIVLLSTAFPAVPKDILLWVGSVAVSWFGAMLILRSARSFWLGKER